MVASSISRIEHTLAGLHKDVPHLSHTKRKWLVYHSWRISVAGATLAVYNLFIIIPLFITALALTPAVNIIGPNVPYYNDSLGLAWLSLLLTGLVFLVTAIMLLVDIKDIKDNTRQGWNTLFRAYLLNLSLGIITNFLVPSLWETLVLVIGAPSIAYLLFEVRSSFKDGQN